jgi:hypothetical protein
MLEARNRTFDRTLLRANHKIHQLKCHMVYPLVILYTLTLWPPWTCLPVPLVKRHGLVYRSKSWPNKLHKTTSHHKSLGSFYLWTDDEYSLALRLQWQAADTEKNLEAELNERSEVTGQLEEVRRWLRETALTLQSTPTSLDPDDIARHTARHEVLQLCSNVFILKKGIGRGMNRKIALPMLRFFLIIFLSL